MRRSVNVDTMIGQRRRRLANTVPTLGERSQLYFKYVRDKTRHHPAKLEKSSLNLNDFFSDRRIKR